MSRIRQRTNADTMQPYYVIYYDGRRVDYGVDRESLDTEYMEDELTPNFTQLLEEGRLPQNLCDYTHSIYNTSQGSMQNFIGGNLNSTTYGDVSGRVMAYNNWTQQQLLPPTPSNLADQARQQALAAIDAPPHAFGEDIAEWKETIGFIKHPFRSLAALGKSFQKDVGRPRTAGLLVKRMADAWTEYRFAVRPLIKSAHEAYVAACERPTAPPARSTARGHAGHNGQVSGNDSGNTTSIYYNYMQSIEVNVKASIYYETRNPVASIPRHLGLRGKDLPSTLWETLPLSFMVDRVYDINSGLKAVANQVDPSIVILGASVTTRSNYVSTYQLDRITGRQGAINGNVMTTNEFGYHRDPWVPDFGDALPTFRGGNLVNSASKVADLGALIVQRFSRR